MPLTRQTRLSVSLTSTTILQDSKPAVQPCRRWWPLIAAVVAFGTVFALAAVRYAPPAPTPNGAPPGEFSAGRAMRLLERLVGDDRPHPVGSEANAQVRAKIVAELARLGYGPKVHQGQVGHVTVDNIVAHRKGTASARSLMLVSHYDSRERGPGAGDSATSVAAILEIARVLRRQPAPRHDFVILLTDGEEAGLLGAKAFVDAAQGHPLAQQVDMVINLDARGTSGASLMYQTSDENLELVRALAGRMRRPVTGSMFNAVYQQLPNDTDFTVFVGAGMKGYNLAFIGDAQNYHTAQDRFVNVDPGTMQHTGDNALALVRALDAADWEQWETDEAVYFDLMALAVVWWPEPWTLPAQAVLLLIMLAVLVRLLRGGALRMREILWGLAAGLILLVLPVSISLLVDQWTGGVVRRQRWPENPLPTILAYWGVGLPVFGAVGWWLSPRAGFWGTWWGVWGWWSVLSTTVTLILPSGSYLFLVPIAAATSASAAAVLMRRLEGIVPQLVAGLAPALAALLLWLPLELLLYEALGLAVNSLTTFRSSLILSCLLPLLPRSRSASA